MVKWKWLVFSFIKKVEPFVFTNHIPTGADFWMYASGSMYCKGKPLVFGYIQSYYRAFKRSPVLHAMWHPQWIGCTGYTCVTAEEINYNFDERPRGHLNESPSISPMNIEWNVSRLKGAVTLRVAKVCFYSENGLIRVHSNTVRWVNMTCAADPGRRFCVDDSPPLHTIIGASQPELPGFEPRRGHVDWIRSEEEIWSLFHVTLGRLIFLLASPKARVFSLFCPTQVPSSPKNNGVAVQEDVFCSLLWQILQLVPAWWRSSFDGNEELLSERTRLRVLDRILVWLVFSRQKIPSRVASQVLSREWILENIPLLCRANWDDPFINRLERY